MKEAHKRSKKPSSPLSKSGILIPPTPESTMPKLIQFLIIGLMLSCEEKPPEGADDDEEEERLEGSEPGDCTDGADNDMDGDFDCDDSGCAGGAERLLLKPIKKSL
jgi:hypothetical protein